tara:strand:- start:3399 stop:3539 length:141 start_codon:yes stop_codon:yes gene_type:complete
MSVCSSAITKKAKDSELSSTRNRRRRVYGCSVWARKHEMSTWLFFR